MCLPYVIALASNTALAIRYNGVAKEDFACPNHSNAARSVKRTITETPGLVRLAERSLSMSRRSHNRKKAFRPGGTTTIVTVRPIYSRDRYTTPHAGFPPVLSSWGSPLLFAIALALAQRQIATRQCPFGRCFTIRCAHATELADGHVRDSNGRSLFNSSSDSSTD